MAKIDTVVFDVGAVLIDWDPRHLYRKLFADHAAMETFLTDICPPEWNWEQDRGRLWADAIAERIAAHPAHEDMIRAYDTRWPEMVSGPIEGTVKLKQDLMDAGIRICAITNFSAEKWVVATAIHPFLADFDAVIVSGDEKLLKPDPAIYRLLYDRHGVNPASAVFIDDRQDNVDASIATGMRAIRFVDPAQARADLAALGLPV